MKAPVANLLVLLALPLLSATPATLAAASAPASAPTSGILAQNDIMITRDPNEVKGLKKLGEIEGRSPFFGLSGKLGDKGATKKLKEAAAELGATKVLIVSEDRMGATTLRGIAYR